MNIEEAKRNVLENVELLEKDIEILQENICELKELLPTIRTEEDVERFNSTFDMGKGLEIIQLF